MRDPKLPVLAVTLLLLATVSAAADLEKGLAAYDSGDYATSLAECQPLAEAGDAMAQFCVGRLYANGFGVPMDDALALKWYGLAAQQGHSEAQFNLGVMHANGWGVPMNDAEAARWYRKSAEQGFIQAQSALGHICYNGRGEEQNIAAAYMWYAIAAQLGDVNAGFKLDNLATELTSDEVATAQAMAEAWLKDYNAEIMHAGRND